jgi:DNA polymerase
MSEFYRPLLEATIQHLEALQARGLKYLVLSPATQAALSSSVPASRKTSLPGGKISSPGPARITAAPPARSLSVPASKTAVSPPPAPAASVPAAKSGSDPDPTSAIAELRQRVMACQKCPPLVRARQNVVFGVGDVHSPLMFVGEAPGADEDAQGEPFVGKAGQLLTRIIQAMGFTRDTVFIANILKCRPDTPGQSAGNRKPTPAEMQTCLPYLLEQIKLIQPKVIVALGATAVEGLLGKTVGISRLRGHFQEFQGTPIMPTYHPAYLLRNQSLAAKREVWEDMLQVLERLERPISEKQRNFFLNRPAAAPESA